MIPITSKNLTKFFLLFLLFIFSSYAYKATNPNYTAYIAISDVSDDFNNSNYNGRLTSTDFIGNWTNANNSYYAYTGGIYTLNEVDLPQITITSPADGYQTSASSVTMQWTLSHEGAGVKNYWIKQNTGNWINVAKNTSYTFNLSCGVSVLYVKATDNFDRNTSAVSISVRRNCPSGGQQQAGGGAAGGGGGGGGFLPRKKGLGEHCTNNSQCESGLCYMLKCAECTDNTACAENEYCSNGLCIQVKCECGEVKEHKCIAYECCSNADCKEGYACDTKTHKCKQIILPKLMIIVPEEINADKVFEIAVRVEKGGYVANATLKINGKTYRTDSRGRVKLKLKAGKYTVTASKEGFTQDVAYITVKKKYRIILPDKVEAGKETKILVLDEEGNPAANVVVTVTLPDGRTVTLKTNEKGEAYLFAENPGKLKVSIGSQTISQVAEEIAVELPQGKIPVVGKPEQLSVLIVVLFAIIIIAALFGGKFTEILKKQKSKKPQQKQTKEQQGKPKWKK